MLNIWTYLLITTLPPIGAAVVLLGARFVKKVIPQLQESTRDWIAGGCMALWGMSLLLMPWAVDELPAEIKAFDFLRLNLGIIMIFVAMRSFIIAFNARRIDPNARLLDQRQ